MVFRDKCYFPTFTHCLIIPSKQVATLPFCPESPKFLLLDKDDEERAVSALTWLRGRIDVHAEMDEMRAEQEKMKLTPHISFKEMFTNGALRSPLIIALMMMLAQQLSGINAVSIYKYNGFLCGGYMQYLGFFLCVNL